MVYLQWFLRNGEGAFDAPPVQGWPKKPSLNRVNSFLNFLQHREPNNSKAKARGLNSLGSANDEFL